MMRQFELVERVMSYDPGADEQLLNRAYVYAMSAHGGQKRASGEAFFNHPLEVAGILTEMKLDGSTIAAALLHDVVEDTESTQAEIEEKFRALAEGVLSAKAQNKLIEAIWNLEKCGSVAKLMALMKADVKKKPKAKAVQKAIKKVREPRNT